MNFIEYYLQETTQEIYHATNIYNLADMVKDNAIKLVLAQGADNSSDVVKGKKKYYYLSAMRVKYGHYAGDKYKDVVKSVIINLNGFAISDVARIVSVNYWGKEFVKLKDFREEQEERILSDKDAFKPISKYVNSVHIYVGNINDHGLKDAFYISNNAPKIGLGVYFYGKGNETAYKMQRTEKAVKDLHELYDENELKNKFKEVYYVIFKSDDGTEKYNKSKWSKEAAEEIVKENPRARIVHEDDIEKENIKNLSYDEEYLIDFLKAYNNQEISIKQKDRIDSDIRMDRLQSIDAAIFNLKRKHSPVINELVKEMKKAKIKDVGEFLKYAAIKINKNY